MLYCVSKKSCPIFVVYLKYKNEQEFLDIQYATKWDTQYDFLVLQNNNVQVCAGL